MVAARHSNPRRVPGALLLLGIGLAACAQSPPQTDKGMLGYGTPDVSAYADGGTTLQAQLETCRSVPRPSSPGQTQGLAAACAQLDRMMRNQPGNSVQPARTP